MEMREKNLRIGVTGKKIGRREEVLTETGRRGDAETGGIGDGETGGVGDRETGGVGGGEAGGGIVGFFISLRRSPRLPVPQSPFLVPGRCYSDTPGHTRYRWRERRDRFPRICGVGA